MTFSSKLRQIFPRLGVAIALLSALLLQTLLCGGADPAVVVYVGQILLVLLGGLASLSAHNAVAAQEVTDDAVELVQERADQVDGVQQALMALEVYLVEQEGLDLQRHGALDARARRSDLGLDRRCVSRAAIRWVASEMAHALAHGEVSSALRQGTAYIEDDEGEDAGA